MIGLDVFNEKYGVCHADELFLMFKMAALPINGVHTDDDRRTSEHLIRLWTNFAKHHDPTPEGSEVKWEGYVLQRLRM